jgi:uncharacterized protein YndB with AHSA1/START domain
VATNTRFMPVPPESIWAVLADPDCYGHWVVGSKRIRDADPDWPQPGSRFHHTVGTGPISVSDHTESLEATFPHRLRLKARALPVGIAEVTLELLPDDGGTTVRMVEDLVGVYAPLTLLPPVHWATRARNAESLKRLETLALRETARS